MVLIVFFLLDYGSHFLQFTANALIKNKSHKTMTDSNENYLVRLYYTNFLVFGITATGSDTALVLFLIYGRCPYFQQFQVCKLIILVGQIIISFKMFVNFYQWTGSVKKLRIYDKDRSHYE